MTKFCKGCGKDIERGLDVRCSKCKKKNTQKRKYKRMHIHRKKTVSKN